MRYGFAKQKKGNGQAIASMYYIKEYEVLVSDACERKLFMKIIDYLEFNAGISIPNNKNFRTANNGHCNP